MSKLSRQRPVNLDLRTLRFPLPAWVSVAHRISGVLLFIAVPFFLWLLQNTVASESEYASLMTVLQQPVMKIGLWVFLSSLIYHSIAGLRHILMDMHLGEHLLGMRLGAKLVCGVSAVLIILLGVRLW